MRCFARKSVAQALDNASDEERRDVAGQSFLMLRISFEEVESRLADVLRGIGFSDARARLCARLFAETTRDGVYSHGVNRFARFVAMVRNGSVDPAAEPKMVARFGAMERWDGQRGPGNLNA